MAFTANPMPAPGTTVTLATFASTDFSSGDFSFTGPAGLQGGFSVSPTILQFVVGPTGDAGYNTWTAANGLPAGLDEPSADADSDGASNLLEYVLGDNPTAPTARGFLVGKLNSAGEDYPTLTFVRRHELGTIATHVAVSTDLGFTSDLGAFEVSATPRGDGFDLVVVRSAIPLSQQPRQFLKLIVSMP